MTVFAARLGYVAQTLSRGAFYFQLVMSYTNGKQPRLDTGKEIKADELILNARLQLYRLSEELIKWQVALYDRDRSLHEKLGKDFNRATLGFYELDEALSSILHKDLEHKIIFCEE